VPQRFVNFQAKQQGMRGFDCNGGTKTTLKKFFFGFRSNSHSGSHSNNNNNTNGGGNARCRFFDTPFRPKCFRTSFYPTILDKVSSKRFCQLWTKNA
jgi:hypothetical protein